MKHANFIPIAALLFAVACSDSVTAPDPGSPSFVKPGSAAPTGTHFQSASADFTSASVNTLQANFDIAGLGNTAGSVTVLATADASALFACQNGGGNFPSDPKKKAESAEVSALGTFTVSNGRATGFLTLSPPASTLHCPGGQTPVLASVTYSNVQVQVVGSSVTATSSNSDIGTSYSRTFFTF
jgi:hypothetical protein